MVEPTYLSVDDVLRIHERVCEDFAQTDDPVGWIGPRDDGALVESAVSRQTVGFGNQLKYPDAYANAATLTFGLCCGHPFHNGNKRTALVAMLAHLDKNGLTIFGIKQRELYGMIKAVATHTLGVRDDPRKKRRGKYTPREADDEVAAIAAWLKRNARKVKHGERPITYRQLRQVLSRFDISLEQPKNMMIGVYKQQPMRKGLLRKNVAEKKRLMSIPNPGDGRVVATKVMKQIRRTCELDEAHGCDTTSFYDGTDVIDVFINEYRNILDKLARE